MRLALAVLACSTPPAEAPPPLEVQVAATDLTASGGLLRVQVAFERGLSVELPKPSVDGLTFSATDDPVVEQVGGRTVVTQRWRFTGKKGSYELAPLQVEAGAHQADSAPLWIDLGVPAPHLDQLADIREPVEVWEVPWGAVATGVGVAGVAVGAFALGVVSVLRRPPEPEAVEPPDLRCLAAWEAVRDHPALTDEEKARELSRIFREYTEEVLGFPAVAWTTTEILAHLDGMRHLEQGNVPRAKKLLRATDLVKYAEQRPDGGFFDEADADLRAFVASTRPRSWGEDGQPGPADA